ncbi:hypothetical protein H7Y40_00525 [Pedobacter sp.]|nr:hypothetical protein [Candidatus Saccharibacteria bacterium]
MFDQGYRDREIAEIGQLVMESSLNKRGAISRLDELRKELDVSFTNVAGHLIRDLERRPLQDRTGKPWGPLLIEEFRAKGAKSRTGGTTPIWLPEQAPATV